MPTVVIDRENALQLADTIVGEGRAMATLDEVATGLTLRPAKLRSDVRLGKLVPTRLGRRLAFSREQIASYIVALHEPVVS